MPTMRRAFDYVLELAGLECRLEQVGCECRFIFAERVLWTPPLVCSRLPIEGDARNELIRASLDGRLKGFAAMPVRDWHKKLKKPRL
jgi:hypothetical protein